MTRRISSRGRLPGGSFCLQGARGTWVPGRLLSVARITHQHTIPIMASCIICKEDYSETQVTRVLPCGHTLCDRCLAYIQCMRPSLCPMCRADLCSRDRGSNPFRRNYALEEILGAHLDGQEAGTRAKPRYPFSLAQLTEAVWVLQVELDESRDALNWATEQWANLISR